MIRRSMWSRRSRVHLWQGLVWCLAASLASGCQRQKATDTGKTYTSDTSPKKGGAGGDANSGGQSDAKPLDAPADTTNGKASKTSDAGSSSATHGQVVAEPGAPVEHEAPPAAPKAPPAGGHS